MTEFRKHSIYRIANPTYSYLVDIQSTFYNALGTRIVIPLYRADAFATPPVDDAFPVLTVNGERFYLLTPEMASIPVSALKFERVAQSDEIEKINRAVDRVLGGY